MGGDFEAEGLVDPSFKASSFPSSITFLNHLLLLWFLTQSKVPRTKRPNCVPRAQSFRSNHGTVEEKVIEVGSEERETTFASVALESSVDNRSDEIIFVSNEPDRTSATENGYADEDPVSFSVLLLFVVEQHLDR